MASGDRILRASVVVMTLCTLIVTGIVVRREVAPATPRRTPPPPEAIAPSDWDLLLTSGHRVGPPTARVTVIEFGDFECPACASFARLVAKIRRAHPEDFAIVYHHLPLDYHQSALPLARASECAAKQGKFEAFYDLVYARQRAMLSLPVTTIADSAGVPNIGSFEKCLADTTQTAAVSKDREIAGRIGASGTPTILAEGMLIRQIVDSAFLEGLLRK